MPKVDLAHLRAAAEAGDADKQFELGDVYRIGTRGGTGVRRNFTDARKWYTKAATQGHAGAQYALGRLGASKDIPMSAAWYIKAASQGHEKAIAALETINTSCLPSVQEAVKQGSPHAHYSLGIRYRAGRHGIAAKDYKEAARLFQIAADQDHGSACLCLSILFAAGFGVSKDAATAVSLFQKHQRLEGETEVTYADALMMLAGILIDSRGTYGPAADTAVDALVAEGVAKGSTIPKEGVYAFRRANKVDKAGVKRLSIAAKDAEAAKAAIWNPKLKAWMALRAQKMVQCACDDFGGFLEAEEIFLELKAKATEECTRLARVTADCRERYTAVQQRWEYVEAIAASDDLHIQADAGEDGHGDLLSEESYVDRLLMRSAWGLPVFETKMRRLETLFNATRYPPSLPGVGPAFSLQLQPKRYPLHNRPGANCHLRIGAVKARGRCLDKAREYASPGEISSHPVKPAARYIIDTLRVTFCFEDPYALAVFYELLKSTPGIRIVRVKNKLTDHRLPLEERTTILINVELLDADPTGVPLLAEVQLTLQDYLDIKKSLHKFYQFDRAHEHTEVLKPIFHAPAPTLSAAETAQAEVAMLRAKLKSAVDGDCFEEAAKLASELAARASAVEAKPLALFSSTELGDHLKFLTERYSSSLTMDSAMELVDQAWQDAQAEERVGQKAEAVYEYQAADVDEISFDPGEIIEDIEVGNEEWWQF